MLFPVRTILFLVIIVGGGIFLQVLLSKMKSRFFGLILPTMFFLWSLLNLSMIIILPDMTTQEIVGQIAGVLLMVNVPTMMLLLVYAICRHQMAECAKKQSEIKKMNTMDLE